MSDTPRTDAAMEEYGRQLLASNYPPDINEVRKQAGDRDIPIAQFVTPRDLPCFDKEEGGEE